MGYPSGQPQESVAPDATTIVLRHQKGVWRYLRMLGCDASTADDLTQETFLKVLGRDTFVYHNEAATSAYLRRTAHNLMVSMVRKTSRVQLSESAEMLDDTWCRWAGADLSGDLAVDALRECLQHLTQRARQALRLRYAEEASRVAIGESLGISEHGARNLMQRAKKQLRSCVESRLNT